MCPHIPVDSGWLQKIADDDSLSEDYDLPDILSSGRFLKIFPRLSPDALTQT